MMVGVSPSPESSFEAAFDGLFLRSRRLAHRMLGDAAAAEDVAAEAMVRTYARWDRVGGLPYLDAWVLRVTTNLALDQLRRRKPVTAPRLEDVFEDATAQRLTLSEALGKLARRQREVIVLRFLAGLTETEIAAALGIRGGTVKTHVSRALAQLRMTLDDGPDEEAPLAFAD